jgi:hypothetical protein
MLHQRAKVEVVTALRDLCFAWLRDCGRVGDGRRTQVTRLIDIRAKVIVQRWRVAGAAVKTWSRQKFRKQVIPVPSTQRLTTGFTCLLDRTPAEVQWQRLSCGEFGPDRRARAR